MRVVVGLSLLGLVVGCASAPEPALSPAQVHELETAYTIVNTACMRSAECRADVRQQLAEYGLADPVPDGPSADIVHGGPLRYPLGTYSPILPQGPFGPYRQEGPYGPYGVYGRYGPWKPLPLVEPPPSPE